MMAYCGWIGWREGCGERCRMHERLRTAGERSFPSLISLVVSVDVKHLVYYGERKIKRVNLLTNKKKGKSTD